MESRPTYAYDDILATYDSIGVVKGATIYVTSDMAKLRGFRDGDGRQQAAAHLSALLEILGNEGTLVAPTSTLNLIDTREPFDPAKTKSFRRGALSEAVRLHPDAVRSFHPLQSYACIGARAREIVTDVPRHAFGYDCVEWRLVQMDALSVSAGPPPRLACSTVHLMEVVCGVPYRFSKEFLMPVVRDGITTVEPYYFPVYYRDTGMERDYNRKIFAALEEIMPIASANLGGGGVHSYSMRAFFENVGRLMSQDLYVWCDKLPVDRPYQRN